MATNKMISPKILITLILISQTRGLTESEERDLILGGDASIIDSKLRELPGGVLIPPEEESLPVPSMDKPANRFKHERVSRIDRGGESNAERVERLRMAVKTMHDRLSSSKSKSTSSRRIYTPPDTSSIRAYTKSRSILESNPATLLEIGLKRIEILSSRAGFNLSSVPRRTQLQIVSRLADKLPLKYSTVVKNGLKNNDAKIFEYLPEGTRDPLIEDRPGFLNHFLENNDEEEKFNEEFTESKPVYTSSVDASLVSIASSNAQDYDKYVNSPLEEGHRDDGYGSGSGISLSIVPPPVDSDNPDDKLESDNEKPTILPKPEMLVSPKNMENWGKPKRVVIKNDPSTTTTTTSTTTTTEKPIERQSKSLISESKHKPIRVSIISKDSIPQSQPAVSSDSMEAESSRQESVRESSPIIITPSDPPLMTTTTESPTSQKLKSLLKYVEVEPLNKSNSSLLFELESESDLDYDLTEEEISAMVKELKKYEEIDGNSDNSLEFDYARLMSPHPLEYPDHPEHPESSVKNEKVTQTTQKPATAVVPSQVNYPHIPYYHPMMRFPPRLMNRLRPRLPPTHPFNTMQMQHMGQSINRPVVRPPPPSQQPMRINDVKVSEIPKHFNKECDYFSNELCLLVQDYPIEAISTAMESQPEMSLNLLPREESLSDSDIKSNEKLSSEGGFLCPSKVAYGKIKKAKSNSNNKWKYIVNYGEKTQTIRMEKCLTPGDRCSYVMPHYRTACTQVYNYHRLLAWDSENGLHIDLFKVPTCCTCHVQGYYSNGNKQSPVVSPKRRMMLVNGQGPIFQGPPVPPQFQGPYNPHFSRFGRRFPPRPFSLGQGQGQNAGQSPSSKIEAITTTVKTEIVKEDDQDLNELLKQYSSLREKISKKRIGDSNSSSSLQQKTTSSRSDRMLKNLNLLESVLLRKRKRSSLNESKLAQFKKLIKKFKAKKRANNNTNIKLSKNNSRTSRMMKLAKNRQIKELKNKLKIKRMQVLIKKLKNNKRRKSVNKNDDKNLSEDSRVNYSYHPIMDYYSKLNKSIIAH